MTTAPVPSRSAITLEHTWNAESVFPTTADWEAELNTILAALPDFKAYAGRLGESAAVLADALALMDDLGRRASKVMFYAFMTYSVDTGNQEAAALVGRAQSMGGQARAAQSFVNPELLSIGEETLTAWIAEEPRLAHVGQYVADLFRQQAHVRSAEVEEVLGMLSEPFSGPEATARMLTDSDFVFDPAVGVDGSSRDLTTGTIDAILHGNDREARRTAWENYADQHLTYKNTLASNLLTSVKQNVFQARARRYDSTLGMALFEDNIPPAVFHTLLDIFKKNLPTWHKYWQVRRRALGVETLQPYDIWAPLTDKPPVLTFDEAVPLICEGLAAMGEDYVETIRKGLVEQRWVDIYPNQGKTAGAFSFGAYDTHPFILMSFTDDVGSLSTLAHELGHSIHSYLTRHNQPFIYGDYSMFEAEVASNFNQAMVRAHLLDKFADDADFQISLLEEAMDNFHRYFFIMPTLARFELEIHERIERGEGVSADDMLNLMADLFAEGYGGEMAVDRDRVGITWAQFSHLFVDYYVFQYATGISGAHAIAKRILDGEPGAVEGHLDFLKSGSSLYPVDSLKLAGVDLSQPEPVEAAFAVLADYVDRLDQLTR